MNNKITRKAFARLAIAAPMVALALKSSGARSVEAASCAFQDAICTQTCNSNCRAICKNSQCDSCLVCGPRPDPTPTPEPSYCSQVNSICSAGCTLNCRNSCAFAGGSCSGCNICNPA